MKKTSASTADLTVTKFEGQKMSAKKRLIASWQHAGPRSAEGTQGVRELFLEQKTFPAGCL
jgi:hypothetical protein